MIHFRIAPDLSRMLAACVTCPGGEYLNPAEAQAMIEALTPEERAKVEQEFTEKVKCLLSQSKSRSTLKD